MGTQTVAGCLGKEHCSVWGAVSEGGAHALGPGALQRASAQVSRAPARGARAAGSWGGRHLQLTLCGF